MFTVTGFLFIGVYLYIDPTTSHPMPKCLFRMLTGYDCPSCGGQRALHALLNGEFYNAFILNPFLFLVAPYLLAILYSTFSKSRVAIATKRIFCHHITVCIYLIIYVLWWVVRNTEWWHNLV